MEISNKTFDTLRFIQSMIVPLASLVSGLTEIVGFPYGIEVAGCLLVLDQFFGVFIENLRKDYNKKLTDE